MERPHLYIRIAAMLAAIALLGVGITMLTAPKAEDTSDGLRIVTGFYPVYIAAQNVAGSVDGVHIVNMIDGQAGCLHDYQMTPQDRMVLESADVFVMNGAGAESVLHAALEELTVPIIDLSKGQELLESGHVHDHAHDHEHEMSEEESNSHLWVSPLRYRLQIETLCAELSKIDPAHAAQYEINAAAYLREIDVVWARMKQAAVPFDDVPTVVFHDSLAYLAEDLDLHVAAAMNIGENSTADPDTLTDAADALRGVENALFLYDSQYESVQYTDLQQAPKHAVVLSVDTCVTGDNNKDRWLQAMNAFCEQLEAAA